MKKKDVRKKDKNFSISGKRIRKFRIKGWQEDSYYTCKKCGGHGFVHPDHDGFVVCPFCHETETLEIQRYFYLGKKLLFN